MIDPKFDPRNREKHGGWQVIFPFNNKSEQVATQMNKMVGGANSMGVPNFMKILVQETKEHYHKQMQYVKQNFHWKKRNAFI